MDKRWHAQRGNDFQEFDSLATDSKSKQDTTYTYLCTILSIPMYLHLFIYFDLQNRKNRIEDCK